MPTAPTKSRTPSSPPTFRQLVPYWNADNEIGASRYVSAWIATASPAQIREFLWNLAPTRHDVVGRGSMGECRRWVAGVVRRSAMQSDIPLTESLLAAVLGRIALWDDHGSGAEIPSQEIWRPLVEHIIQRCEGDRDEAATVMTVVLNDPNNDRAPMGARYVLSQCAPVITALRENTTFADQLEATFRLRNCLGSAAETNPAPLRRAMQFIEGITQSVALARLGRLSEAECDRCWRGIIDGAVFERSSEEAKATRLHATAQILLQLPPQQAAGALRGASPSLPRVLAFAQAFQMASSAWRASVPPRTMAKLLTSALSEDQRLAIICAVGDESPEPSPSTTSRARRR